MSEGRAGRAAIRDRILLALLILVALFLIARVAGPKLLERRLASPPPPPPVVGPRATVEARVHDCGATVAPRLVHATKLVPLARGQLLRAGVSEAGATMRQALGMIARASEGLADCGGSVDAATPGSVVALFPGEPDDAHAALAGRIAEVEREAALIAAEALAPTEPERALALLEDRSRLTPEQVPAAELIRAVAFEASGRPERAIETLTALAVHHRVDERDTYETSTVRALAAARLGDVARAVAFLDDARARDVDPERPDAAAISAILHLARDRPEWPGYPVNVGPTAADREVAGWDLDVVAKGIDHPEAWQALPTARSVPAAAVAFAARVVGSERRLGLLRRAIVLDPRLGFARLELASAAAIAGRADEASASLDAFAALGNAVSDAGGSVDGVRLPIPLLSDASRIEAVLVVLAGDAGGASPSSSRVRQRLDRAAGAVAGRALELALAILDEVRAFAPADPDGWILRARALDRLERADEAGAALDQGCALAPGQGRLLAARAEWRLRRGGEDEDMLAGAEKDADCAIAAMSDRPDSLVELATRHRVRARIRMARGDRAGALEDYRRVVAVDGTSVEALASLLDAAIKRGDASARLRLRVALETAQSVRSWRASLLVARATSARRSGRGWEAFELAEEAFDLDPGSGQVWLARARCRLDLDGAIATFLLDLGRATLLDAGIWREPIQNALWDGWKARTPTAFIAGLEPFAAAGAPRVDDARVVRALMRVLLAYRTPGVVPVGYAAELDSVLERHPRSVIVLAHRAALLHAALESGGGPGIDLEGGAARVQADVDAALALSPGDPLANLVAAQLLAAGFPTPVERGEPFERAVDHLVRAIDGGVPPNVVRGIIALGEVERAPEVEEALHRQRERHGVR